MHIMNSQFSMMVISGEGVERDHGEIHMQLQEYLKHFIS